MIPYSTYLQIEGLLVLGHKYVKQAEGTIEALAELTGEGEPCFCEEAIFDAMTSATELLKRLNIEVEEPNGQ